MKIDDIFADEELKEDSFSVTDDSTANWAVKTIYNASVERDRLLSLVSEEQERLDVKRQKILDAFERDTGWLKYQLEQYSKNVEMKVSKTGASATYKLLNGTLKTKRGGYEYKRDSVVLAKWAKENRPEFLKTKIEESCNWEELKKQIQVSENGEVVDTTTGLIITGVVAEKKDDTFEIKFN